MGYILAFLGFFLWGYSRLKKALMQMLEGKQQEVQGQFESREATYTHALTSLDEAKKRYHNLQPAIQDLAECSEKEVDFLKNKYANEEEKLRQHYVSILEKEKTHLEVQRKNFLRRGLIQAVADRVQDMEKEAFQRCAGFTTEVIFSTQASPVDVQVDADAYKQAMEERRILLELIGRWSPAVKKGSL